MVAKYPHPETAFEKAHKEIANVCNNALYSLISYLNDSQCVIDVFELDMKQSLFSNQLQMEELVSFMLLCTFIVVLKFLHFRIPHTSYHQIKWLFLFTYHLICFSM